MLEYCKVQCSPSIRSDIYWIRAVLNVFFVLCEIHVDRKILLLRGFLILPKYSVSYMFAVSCPNLNFNWITFLSNCILKNHFYSAFEWFIGSFVESVISMEYGKALHWSIILVYSKISLCWTVIKLLRWVLLLLPLTDCCRCFLCNV